MAEGGLFSIQMLAGRVFLLCPGSRESNKAGACGAEEQELCNFASLGFAPVIIIFHEGCGLAVSQWRNFEAEVLAYHYNIHPINLTLVTGPVVSVSVMV